MERGEISVLVVEDNDVFREALELMLGFVSGLRVVGAVGDGESAVHACAELRPDVVLLDYRLPGLDGVQATTAVREAFPDVAVVCLTARITRGEEEALRHAGAAACLSKDQDLDELVDALLGAASRRQPAQA